MTIIDTLNHIGHTQYVLLCLSVVNLLLQAACVALALWMLHLQRKLRQGLANNRAAYIQSIVDLSARVAELEGERR